MAKCLNYQNATPGEKKKFPYDAVSSREIVLCGSMCGWGSMIYFMALNQVVPLLDQFLFCSIENYKTYYNDLL